MFFKILFLSILAAALALSAWMFIFRRKEPAALDSKLSPLDGLYLLSKGDRSGALKFFIALASEGGSTPADYLTAAVLMRTVGDAKGAVYVLESLLLRRSTPPPIVRLSIGELILCYRIIGNTHSGAGCINSVRERGHWDEIILLEAMIASDRGDYELAVSKFQRYQKITNVDLSKEISYVHLNAAMKSADRSFSVKQLKSALKCYPANHKAFFTLLSITEDWELCKSAVEDDIIRTREDRIAIENICYKLSKLDELIAILVKKTEAGGAHPAAYLFLAAYYKKMGEAAAAAAVIRDYINKRSAVPVIKKNYIEVANDPFLTSLFRQEKDYFCSACGQEFLDYSEVCQVCGEIGSVNYKL
ncbi:MAG: hypothetical protein LBP51_04140 [Deferribacteraceae bacterium]|jgi:hypothetical protein|nr:hypothetical protein [Deferribacteraceae bacterium]